MFFQNILLPLSPILLYTVIILVNFKNLIKKIPSDSQHATYDQGMNLCVSLLGFSITILCVLLTLDKIKTERQSTTIFHLVFSISYFLISYTLFRLRIREIFVVSALALKNAGLWTLVSGTMFFLYGLSSAYIILLVILILFTIFLIVDILFTSEFLIKKWSKK